MKTEINPKTGREVRVFESTQERLDWQNAQYAKFRSKLDDDPAKLAEYRARKREASKRCNDKKRAKLQQLEAELAELRNNQ
jgi:hypothetical protein